MRPGNKKADKKDLHLFEQLLPLQKIFLLY